MTDTPQQLKARARRAYEQAIADVQIERPGSVDPVELARLERAVRSLPRTTREVFLAHRIDGLRYADIGAATGLDREQVVRHMADALFYLSRFMEGEEQPAWRRWLQARWPR